MPAAVKTRFASAGGGDKKLLGECVSLLAEAGIKLPADTSTANFTDRLRTALAALLGAIKGGKAKELFATDAPTVDEGGEGEGTDGKELQMSTLAGRSVGKNTAKWIAERAESASRHSRGLAGGGDAAGAAAADIADRAQRASKML